MTGKLLVFAFVSLAAISVFGQQTEQRIGRIVLSQPFSRSYLGVQTKEITKENFEKYNLREVRGVAVEAVAKDSPAEKAGIQTGDVIVSFDGEEVSSVYKLTRLLNEIAPDHSAKITVVRGGGEIDLTATPGRREAARLANGIDPDDFPFPGTPELRRVPMMPNGVQTLPIPPMGDGDVFFYRAAPNRQIGINAALLTKQLGDYFGVASGEGLLISFVRENSPAAKAGLKAGDVITEADGKAIKSVADLARALGEKKEGDVTLTVVRDKNRQTIKVTPVAAKDAPAQFRYFGDQNNVRQNRFR